MSDQPLNLIFHLKYFYAEFNWNPIWRDEMSANPKIPAHYLIFADEMGAIANHCKH